MCLNLIPIVAVVFSVNVLEMPGTVHLQTLILLLLIVLNLN